MAGVESSGEGPNDHPPVVEYARPRRAPGRMSGLAVWCMLLSLAPCPCLLMGILSKLVEWQILPALHPLPLLIAAPVGVIALSTFVLVVIRRSNGRLEGEDHIYFAYSFSALWLFGLLAIWAYLG